MSEKLETAKRLLVGLEQRIEDNGMKATPDEAILRLLVEDFIARETPYRWRQFGIDRDGMMWSGDSWLPKAPQPPEDDTVLLDLATASCINCGKVDCECKREGFTYIPEDQF